MPDREVTLERREPALVEHLGDEAHVLHDRDGLAVAHGDPGGLLAAVLERVEPQVRQVRDRLAGRVDTEHAARVGQALVVHPTRGLGIHRHQYPM